MASSDPASGARTSPSRLVTGCVTDWTIPARPDAGGAGSADAVDHADPSSHAPADNPRTAPHRRASLFQGCARTEGRDDSDVTAPPRQAGITGQGRRNAATRAKRYPGMCLSERKFTLTVTGQLRTVVIAPTCHTLVEEVGPIRA